MKRMILVLIWLMFMSGMIFSFESRAFCETGKDKTQPKQKIEKKIPDHKKGKRIEKEKKELTPEEWLKAVEKMFEEKYKKPAIAKLEENIKELEKAFKEKTLYIDAVGIILDVGRADAPRGIPILTKILLEYNFDLEDEGTRNEILPSADVRRNAALALGWIGDPSAIPALKKAYETDSEKRVRSEARSAIYWIKFKQALLTVPNRNRILACKKLFKDEDDWIKHIAAWKLITKQDFLYPNEKDIQEARDVLRELSINSKDEGTRRSALKILSEHTK